MRVLVFNCGSSSIRYEAFAGPECSLLAAGLVERIGSAEGRLRQRRRLPDGTFAALERARPLPDHRAGFDLLAEASGEEGLLHGAEGLEGIGHRVVHGGETFREPALIDEEVVAAVRRLIPLAPLHNPSNLLGIEIARERFPGVPQVAVFDTAFHQTLPPRAGRYALPQGICDTHRIRRYGFHGTSHAYVAAAAARHLGAPPARLNLITLHLGNGASATAIRAGRSVDTSMGLSPLEGLVMGTRCGDVDPSLPFLLMREAGLSPGEAERLLNHESGLRGICGDADMREVLARAAAGDRSAALALDMFCYRIKKYLGAYCAVLGRLDAVVFTGGIGEHAAEVRRRACEGLEHLGIAVDARRNAAAGNDAPEFQQDGAPVRLLVIPTDEEREIARLTLAAIARRPGTPATVQRTP